MSGREGSLGQCMSPEFDCEAAYEALMNIATENQRRVVAHSFHHEFVKEMLRREHQNVMCTPNDNKDSDGLRLCLKKMEACAAAFERFNQIAREMDKSKFKELFLDGNFQPCGFAKEHRTRAFYVNVARIEKGSRHLIKGSPQYYSTMVVSIWAYMSSFAQTVGYGPGQMNRPFMIFDDFERGMLDFNFFYILEQFTLIRDLFPLHGFVTISGLSRVFSPMVNLMKQVLGDDSRGFNFVFRDENLVEYIESQITPGPEESTCIPLLLGNDDDISICDKEEGSDPFTCVPYDPEHRRNVFMVEKLLDDNDSITVADVYNNANYDWSIRYNANTDITRKETLCRMSVLDTVIEGEGDDDSW